MVKKRQSLTETERRNTRLASRKHEHARGPQRERRRQGPLTQNRHASTAIDPPLVTVTNTVAPAVGAAPAGVMTPAGVALGVRSARVAGRETVPVVQAHGAGDVDAALPAVGARAADARREPGLGRGLQVRAADAAVERVGEAVVAAGDVVGDDVAHAAVVVVLEAALRAGAELLEAVAGVDGLRAVGRGRAGEQAEDEEEGGPARHGLGRGLGHRVTLWRSSEDSVERVRIAASGWRAKAVRCQDAAARSG